MKIVYLTHSLRSCWNHGNAHFVRGVVRALSGLGHDVGVWEPEDGWSLTQLRADQGDDAVASFHRSFPDLHSSIYRNENIEQIADGADVVVVHEWTEPSIVARLGELRRGGAPYLLFFHDTHHRAVSDPGSIDRKALENYDAILAFGESLSVIYRTWGFAAYTWHEAADTSHFFPRQAADSQENPDGIVWIGNWGDDERTAELETFLFGPAERESLTLTVRGVRYPEAALQRLERMGGRYGGWIANADAPELYARHCMTVHVPRKFYLHHLPGIPTIRVFEALACGIPLISAWWPDDECLFREGDFLVARSGEEMQSHMRALDNDPDLRRAVVRQGLDRVRQNHTCGHRAEELLSIVGSLRPSLRSGVQQRGAA